MSTAPVPVLRVRGLHSGRSLLTAPPGALQVADNVVLSQPDTVEPRRGQHVVGTYREGDFADGQDESGLVSNGRALVWSMDENGEGHVSWGFPSSMTQLLGEYGQGPMTVPLLRDMPGLGQVLLLSDGTRVARPGRGFSSAPLDTLGVERALDPVAALTGTTGFLATGQSVAYRVTFGRYVAGRWTEGAPSGRVVITNASGGSRNVTLVVRTPPTLEEGGANNLLRVYRSDAVTTGVPLDEVFLAWEGAADINSTTVTDITPAEFLGAPLYTNAETGDGFGLAGANDAPPRGASDVCAWNGRAWWAAWADNAPAYSQLIGVGAPSGLQAGDTVTLLSEGLTLTARTAPTLPNEFKLTTSGSPAADVEATARALVDKVNERSTLLYAWYAAGEDDYPGRIEFRARRATDGSSITCSRPTAWASRFVGGVIADAGREHTVGSIRYSKLGQYEACPRSFSFPVGAPDVPIIAMAALRERLLVAKADGLYLVSGDGPFSVQLLDASVRMGFQARTLAVLGGQAILLASDDRVYAVSEGGARDISEPVQDILASASLLGPAACAAADDVEGRYILHLGATNERTLVWHAHAAGWTTWSLDRKWVSYDAATPAIGASGTSSGSGLPALYSGVHGELYQERNAGTVDDYVDAESDVVLTVATAPADGLQVLTGGGFAGAVGDSVRAGANVGVVIEAALNRRTIALMSGTVGGFPLGAQLVTIGTAYSCSASFAPWHGGQPSQRKQVTAAHLHFARLGAGGRSAVFGGTAPPIAVTLLADTQGAPGSNGAPAQALTGPEISGSWGALVQPRSVRVLVPQEQQGHAMLSPGVSVRQARALWRLSGYTLEVAGGSTRVAR